MRLAAPCDLAQIVGMQTRPADYRQFQSLSEMETDRLARQIAGHLEPGDTILLYGLVGAGKSAFARAVIRALLPEADATQDIPSPSFTLVQEYQTTKGPLWHADLYRLSDPSEIVELGLEEAFDDAICMVEWAEKLGPLRPDGAIEIRLAQGKEENQREISFSGPPDGVKRLLGDDPAPERP